MRRLDIFKLHTQTEVGTAWSAMSMLKIMRPHDVSSITLHRGYFEITPSLTVKIGVYEKTAEEISSTLKKHSDQAPASESYAIREVKVDVKYKNSENPDMSIPPEQRTKAYKYGNNNNPLSQAIEDALKFNPEKAIKLIDMNSLAPTCRSSSSSVSPRCQSLHNQIREGGCPAPRRRGVGLIPTPSSMRGQARKCSPYRPCALNADDSDK